MPRPKVQKNQIKYKYSKHQVVWAKIASFPWWPASITCTPSKTNCYYKVDFIGDRSYAFLSESKIAKYANFREQYQVNKKNNKHFTNAVTIAARKFQELLFKQGTVIKSKGSIECRTSQQKQLLFKQIDLPKIQEKIQQISSQNQKEKNNQSIPLKEENQIQQTQQIFQPEQDNHKQCDLSQQVEAQKAPILMEQENLCSDSTNRQKLIEQLLTKYKLNCIPILKDLRKYQIQNQKKKIHWKRKFIIKNKKSSQAYSDYSFNEEQLLTRTIYRFLVRKLHSNELCRKISLSLKTQITQQKAQKPQCLKKVIQWIQMSQTQSVLNFHDQWINYYKQNHDGQKQKHSNVTMQDQSQGIQIK